MTRVACIASPVATRRWSGNDAPLDGSSQGFDDQADTAAPRMPSSREEEAAGDR